MPAKTVDEYLQALPPEKHKMLEELRQTIKKAAPEAEELISYQIPTYKYKGALVHFAAFANHCSLIAVSKKTVEAFSVELSSFKVSGTTIQFTPGKPLRASLVQKIVRARLKENEERPVKRMMKK